MSQNFLDMQSIPLSIGITCKLFSIKFTEVNVHFILIAALSLAAVLDDILLQFFLSLLVSMLPCPSPKMLPNTGASARLPASEFADQVFRDDDAL